MDERFENFYIDISSPNHQDQIFSHLEQYGFVTFDRMDSIEHFASLAKSLGLIRKHRDSNAEGITRIAPASMPSGDVGYLGFSSGELVPHTDGSSVTNPPDLMMIFCAKPAPTGGASVFVDGKDIYDALEQHFPEALAKLLIPRSVGFGNNGCPHVDSIFSKLPNGNLAMRFRYDAGIYLSLQIIPVLPLLMKLIDEHSFSICLERHQGYILQNRRWLHGRTRFSGEREMYRILVDSYAEVPSRKRVAIGFAPSKGNSF